MPYDCAAELRRRLEQALGLEVGPLFAESEVVRLERLEPKIVLTISGDPDDASARRSLHLGAHDLISKPIPWEYLEWALKLRL